MGNSPFLMHYIANRRDVAQNKVGDLLAQVIYIRQTKEKFNFYENWVDLGNRNILISRKHDHLG
jgi:hypothetical protein